jgi:hypothetical protein
MTKIIILDNESAYLWFHTEPKIVEHKIKKFIFGENFRNLLNQGTETLIKYGAKKWLSDDRLNPIFTEEDSNWLEKNWIKKTIDGGWRYWAIIIPINSFGKYNIDQFSEHNKKLGIISKYFEERDKAYKWLEMQP